MNSDNNQSDNLNSEAPQYDRGIVPTDIAERKEREGDSFGSTREGRDPESIDTTAGMTTDQEGRSNVYPVEPEMYVEEPGDMKEEEEAQKAERAQALQELNAEKDEQGEVRGGGAL